MTSRSRAGFNDMKGKAIIISAPSGAGKTTLVRHLLESFPCLEFSISACSRPKRESETDGTDYHFMTPEIFRRKIRGGEFVEWQEVYPGKYYGTLKTELERIWKDDKIPVFDVDVVGGINLKRYFGHEALAVFVRPPSLKELENRLRNRGTETEESLRTRLEKAEREMSQAGRFDVTVLNDDLKAACDQAGSLVSNFLGLTKT